MLLITTLLVLKLYWKEKNVLNFLKAFLSHLGRKIKTRRATRSQSRTSKITGGRRLYQYNVDDFRFQF